MFRCREMYIYDGVPGYTCMGVLGRVWSELCV